MNSHNFVQQKFHFMVLDRCLISHNRLTILSSKVGLSSLYSPLSNEVDAPGSRDQKSSVKDKITCCRSSLYRYRRRLNQDHNNKALVDPLPKRSSAFFTREIDMWTIRTREVWRHSPTQNRSSNAGQVCNRRTPAMIAAPTHACSDLTICRFTIHEVLQKLKTLGWILIQFLLIRSSNRISPDSQVPSYLSTAFHERLHYDSAFITYILQDGENLAPIDMPTLARYLALSTPRPRYGEQVAESNRERASSSVRFPNLFRPLSY
jgi:hypothetical protein